MIGGIVLAKPRILVIGNSCVDFYVKTRRLAEKGEKVVTPYDYEFVPGGRGLFSAVAACQLSSDVLMCTRVGDDTYGDKLRSIYAGKGIDPRFIITDKKHKTGLDTYIVEGTSVPRVISCPGASAALSDEDIEEAFMSYPDAVLFHFELSDAIIFEAVKQANKNKVPVMIDPCRENLREFDFDLLGDIEIFSPNADETYQMTGIVPDDVESCLKACIRIINLIKCHYVVIKLGAKGCFVFDGVYSQIVPAFDTQTNFRGAVSSVFNAALLHGYLRSGDIIEAAQFANAVASLCLTKEGTFYSIPELCEVEEYIKNNRSDF